MENKSYYTVVGVFFVAVLTAIFAFVWWLSAKDGPGDQKTTHSYYIYTKELPSGLKVGSDVKYLGVSVGSVKKIDFAKISEGVINLEVSSIYQLPLRKDSLARVEVQALSGIASINITKGEGEEFKKGEVPAIKLDQSLLDKLGANAKDITQNLNDAMVQVLKIFSDENVIKITSMIKSLEEMSSNLNESGAIKSLSATAKNLEIISKNLENNQTNFANLGVDISEMVKSIKTTSGNFNTLVSTVQKGLNSGNYDVSSTLTPAMNDISLTMNELRVTLKEIQNTLFRLEESPYDFFFEEKNKENR